MANFYFKKYEHDYEIDFYNNCTTDEFDFLYKNKIPIGCYYRNVDGDEWARKISGMTFDIKGMSYYTKLKKYLDNRFNIIIRKEKLKKLNKIQL